MLGASESAQEDLGADFAFHAQVKKLSPVYWVPFLLRATASKSFSKLSLLRDRGRKMLRYSGFLGARRRSISPSTEGKERRFALL